MKKLIVVLSALCLVLSAGVARAAEREADFQQVAYRDASGAMTEATDVKSIHSSMDRTIGGGNWYAIGENTTVETLTVNGTANLILADGTTLTVNGGIRVEGDNALNIYGQSAGTGWLVANGVDGCAGIGGRKGADGDGGAGGSGGVVTVYGGMVMAKGGQGGAGIGGGAGGGGEDGGYSYAIPPGGDGGAGGSGCAFTVYGGTVTAIGGQGGAGIGGGRGGGGGAGGRGPENPWGDTEYGPRGNGGKGGGGGAVVMKGGTVTATGNRAADIGGGGGGDGNESGTDGAGAIVTIDGGSVKAEIQGQPKNGAGKDVYCVSVEVEKLKAEKLKVEGLGEYGTRDIVPIDGRVYLWLPDGTHSFTFSDGVTTLRYCAIVKGHGMTVEPLSPSGEIGFFVDGADVGKDPRTGWYYDSGVLTFNEGGTYVLSGVAQENEVQILVRTEGVTLVLSNAVAITSGRSALDIRANASLLMAGDTSYLMTTNGASAVNVAADAALTVNLGDGGDRLETMICVFGSEKSAIGGDGRVTANGGTFFAWSDAPACEKSDGITCGEDMVMKAGDDPESVMFAPTPRNWPCVLVAPVCRVRVPAGIAGFASTAVSNQTEEISISKTDGAYNVFNAMLFDDVTIDFTAAEGHEILSGGHIDIPAIANDVTVGSAGYPVPDVRRQLTVTLPTTLEGETYVVTEGGNEVEKVGGGGDDGTSVYPVRSGYDVEIVCTAQEGWRIVSETNVVRFANISENQVLTAADLPQARRIFTVTVPEVENATHELSADDGQMTAVGGSGANTYTILSNAEVTVTFVANDGCRITANGEKAWTLTGDVTFGTTEGYQLPTVEIVPGMAAAPWTVGEGVVAYTNETGKLIITGTGAMDDFASAADVPWDPAAVTAVSVGEGVTKVGANAFAGLAGNVPVLGLTATVWNNSIPAPAVPSGAISGAEVDAVQIIDGKAYLGVSVYTSDALTNQNWSVATNGVIVVPAGGKSGFFYLMSKPSAPADAIHAPIFMPENVE